MIYLSPKNRQGNKVHFSPLRSTMLTFRWKSLFDAVAKAKFLVGGRVDSKDDSDGRATSFFSSYRILSLDD